MPTQYIVSSDVRSCRHDLNSSTYDALGADVDTRYTLSQVPRLLAKGGWPQVLRDSLQHIQSRALKKGCPFGGPFIKP